MDRERKDLRNYAGCMLAIIIAAAAVVAFAYIVVTG